MHIPGCLLRLPVPLCLGPLLDLLRLADDVAVGQPLTDLLERHQVEAVAGGPTRYEVFGDESVLPVLAVALPPPLALVLPLLAVPLPLLPPLVLTLNLRQLPLPRRRWRQGRLGEQQLLFLRGQVRRVEDGLPVLGALLRVHAGLHAVLVLVVRVLVLLVARTAAGLEVVV